MPRGNLGYVLVPDDSVAAVHQLLMTLLDLDAPAPAEIAPTIGLDPASMVNVGKREDVTSNRAFLSMLQGAVHLPADESLTTAEVRAHTAAVAEELVERLVAKMKNPTP